MTDKTKCNSCLYFHLNHEDLPPMWRTGEHGLCLSPWRPWHAKHKDSPRCIYWREEPKTGNPGIGEMTADQLYDYKDYLKRQRVVGRNQYATHTRQVNKMMLGKVNAELRQRGLPATRPDDMRVYGPGRGAWQRAGG